MPGKRELVIAFFPSTLFLIVFLESYLTNSTHFEFGLPAHVVAIFTVYFILAGTCFVVQVPKYSRSLITPSLLGLGVLLWLQAVFVVSDFGFFDGSGIDWEMLEWRMWLEVIVALLFIVVLWRFHKVALREAIYICGLLTALLILPLLPVWFANTDAPKTDREYVFTSDGLTEFSSKQNVIVIVVDTLQSDVVARLVKEEGRWADLFSGFTFFTNGMSSFPKTYASVPSILTGQVYDNSVKFKDYLAAAYFGESILKVLSDNEFDVVVKPYRTQPLIAHPDLVSNVATARGSLGSTHAETEFAKLSSLTLFRLAPTVLKSWVHNDGELRFLPDETNTENCPVTKKYSMDNKHSDLVFLDQFLSCAKVSDAVPRFRFYHLSGAHQPFVLTENLEHHPPAKSSRAAFIAHTKGALAVLEKMFTHLKKIGVYDQSLVVIVGDHGGGELNVGTDPLGLGVIDEIANNPADLTPVVSTSALIAGATPAILIKKPLVKGPVAISNSPVLLADIPETIFDSLGIDAGDGWSMYRIPENEQRVRRHSYYKFSGWNLDYILPMTEFVVEGHSWDPASWRLGDRDLNLEAEEASGGNLANMFFGGNPERVLGDGWRKPDVEGVRLEDTGAEILLSGQFPNATLPLVVTLVGGPTSGASAVPLTIDVNQTKVERWNIRRGERRRYTLLPRAVLSGGQLAINLSTESPEDARRLKFKQLSVSPVSMVPYVFGQTLNFASGGSGKQYVIEGLASAEKWGTWSNRDRILMLIPLENIPETDLRATVKFRGFVRGADHFQSVNIFAGGKLVENWRLESPDIRVRELNIARDLVNGSGYLVLEFRLPGAVSPYELGRSNDRRRLAIGFVQISINPT